jgi:hypothetical protein
MSLFVKKLALLGAQNKKYKSRNARFIEYMKNAEVSSINGDVFCFEVNDNYLKHMIYFCDDLNNLLEFIKKSDVKYEISLGELEYNFLKKHYQFSEEKHFDCYKLASFDKAQKFESIKEIDHFREKDYEVIKDFSPLHQTQFGKNEVMGLVNSQGKGYIGLDDSFLYIEDHPKLDSRFGSTLYSKGSGVEVIKLLSHSILDFKSTKLKNYFTYLEPENIKTILLHEKLGFEPLRPKLSLFEVIT